MVLVLALLVVAALPMLVVADLVSGGDGYGLCAEGLTSCRTSYFDGPELAAFIVMVMFVLVAAIRIVQVGMRRLERSRSERLTGPLSPPRRTISRSPSSPRRP